MVSTSKSYIVSAACPMPVVTINGLQAALSDQAMSRQLLIFIGGMESRAPWCRGPAIYQTRRDLATSLS